MLPIRAADLKDWIKSNPWLFYLASRKGSGAAAHKRAIDPSCELVIEGFPRSANSFCIAAFQQAQGRAVKVANHCHTPSQFMLAARWKVPGLLLLREPESAALSNLIFYAGRSTPERIIERYIAFHRPLVDLREAMVVADFADVTRDFGAVIRNINRRFGTSFVPFEHTADNVERVRAHLDGIVRERTATRRATSGPLPSAMKEETKRALKEQLASAPNQELLAQARALYERLRPQPAGGLA